LEEEKKKEEEECFSIVDEMRHLGVLTSESGAA